MSSRLGFHSSSLRKKRQNMRISYSLNHPWSLNLSSTSTQTKKNKNLPRPNQTDIKMMTTKTAIVVAKIVTLMKKATTTTAMPKTKNKPQSDKTLSILPSTRRLSRQINKNFNPISAMMSKNHHSSKYSSLGTSRTSARLILLRKLMNYVTIWLSKSVDKVSHRGWTPRSANCKLI